MTRKSSSVMGNNSQLHTGSSLHDSQVAQQVEDSLQAAQSLKIQSLFFQTIPTIYITLWWEMSYESCKVQELSKTCELFTSSVFNELPSGMECFNF